MAEEVSTFHWADYLVFTLSLLVSAGIGIFFGFVSKKNRTTKDFLVGGREMGPLPVGISILASFTSAPAVIGTPTEVYYFGTTYMWCLIGYSLSAVIAAHLFIPVFHRMQVTSAYEYLEQRYSKPVRIMGSVTFAFMMLLYMGVSIYAPAAAFSQVTGLNMYLSVLGVGIICTFYTSVGGMKAVIWTDVLQMSIILLGVFVLVIMGGLNVGSLDKISSIVSDGGRWRWLEFSPDPRRRYTFWTQSVGIAFMSTAILGSNQAMIQRYLSIKKTRDAQKSVYYALFFLVLFTILIVALGCVMYAFYHTCDPIGSRLVEKPDQIVPYFVMQTFGNLHGLPGLFSAAVFSATLSTVSSGLNALAAVFLVDFVHPLYHMTTKTRLREKIATIVSKLTAAILGGVTIGIAYLAPLLGDTLLQISLSIFGMVGGPLLGLFSLAIFVPWSNKWGGMAGLISGLIFSFWLSIGAIIQGNNLETLPLRMDNCSVTAMSYIQTTTTMADLTTISQGAESHDDDFVIYHVSYIWYSLYSVTVALIVGCVVSALTGFNHGERPPANLIYDYPGRCGCCCRGACLNLCLGAEPLDHKTQVHVINGDLELTKANMNGGSFSNQGYDGTGDVESGSFGDNKVAPEQTKDPGQVSAVKF